MNQITLFSFMLIFGVALGSSLLLTSVARWIAPRIGIIDKPRNRHVHPIPTPKTGGFAIAGSFIIAAFLAQILPIPRTDPKEIIRFTGLVVGGVAAFLLGLWDDKRELSQLPQFVGQILIAAIGVVFLIFIERFNNPLDSQQVELPYLLTVIVSLFWMGLMMNTVNWLDGMDGLAGGVVLIAAILLFIHTVREGQISVSLLPLALIGSVLGFLFFNWNPAKIFMGGTGAMFLGYTLGALSIIGGAKMATILLVMGLPLLDVAWQIVRRVRSGKNPGVGDRGHIHFRLIDRGVPVPLIASGYYLFCAAFGAIALLTSSRQFKLIAILTMFGLIVGGFAVLSRVARIKDDTPEKQAGID
jgi:UDP-GlcNAc:undecaprenyl-phosphate/decaprenyl-phosphate GlcNAc-1-phosphate transferase